VKPVTFHADALAELDAAAAYYEAQRAGLGADFRSEVEAALQRIQHHPWAYAQQRGSACRKCLVTRYPYSVYFLERDHDIWIAAVAHHKRRYGYWMNRSPDDP
jgi:plasmid stabilization system protein ParE